MINKKDLKAHNRIAEREEKMYRIAEKKIREKNEDWLGRFLEKFSSEGGFWLKDKFRKDDWL